MGALLVRAGFKKRKREAYQEHPELRRWRDQFETMFFSEDEIGQLYEQFIIIDHDRSGELKEMLQVADQLERFRFDSDSCQGPAQVWIGHRLPQGT